MYYRELQRAWIRPDADVVSTEFVRAVARAVKAERARGDLTQAQLAERLGIDKGTVSQIERMARRIYLDEVPDLCAALGVTLAELLAKVPDEDRTKLGLS